MTETYETDVAQSVTDGTYFEALDVFTCGLGLYAVLCLAGHAKQYQGVCLMEIINLDGRSLSQALEASGIQDCLDDYCFIATRDIVAQSKAKKRLSDQTANPRGLADADVEKDARTLEEIEDALGCPILEHPQARKALYVHKWGVIELITRD
ncbi:MAG: hypothetical protein GX418_14185 [Clostridiales bacterium]|nr:hypothetical protein [Clostridiales bacterium]